MALERNFGAEESPGCPWVPASRRRHQPSQEAAHKGAVEFTTAAGSLAPPILRTPLLPGDAARGDGAVEMSTGDVDGPDGCLLRGSAAGDLFYATTHFGDLGYCTGALEGISEASLWQALRSEDGIDHASGQKASVRYSPGARQVIMALEPSSPRPSAILSNVEDKHEMVYTLHRSPLRIECFKRLHAMKIRVPLDITRAEVESAIELITMRARRIMLDKITADPQEGL